MDKRIARIEHDLMARYHADGATATWQKAFRLIAEQEGTIDRLQGGLRKLRGSLNRFACKCGASGHVRHAEYCPVYLVPFFTALLEGTPLPE